MTIIIQNTLILNSDMSVIKRIKEQSQVAMQEQIADIMTKLLGTKKFLYFQEMIRVYT